jgi:hypothetical protein
MNRFQEIFDAQKLYFASNVTRSHAWRVEQLDCMAKIIEENETALQQAIPALRRQTRNTSSKARPRMLSQIIRKANFSRG